MPYDGLFTYALAGELQAAKGARILKIHQPYANEIVMTVRNHGQNHKLLLSAHPAHARVQFTKETYENPKEPPMFCMLLRKHAEGFFIENIIQKGLDRILIFRIKGRNEIGDLAYKRLIVEIMGRHSNIILVDEEKGTIIDSIKHISHAVNRYRAVLPGQPYIWPPDQAKLHPFESNQEDVLRVIDFNAGKLDSQIVKNFTGISPVFAKEIIFQSGLANRTTLPETFIDLMKKIEKLDIQPTIIRGPKKEDFYLFNLEHLEGERIIFSSISDLLDQFYYGKAERDRVKQIAGDIEKFIRNEIDKNRKKIKKLNATLEDAENSSIYRLYGELLTANIYRMEKGMKQITVENYYAEDNKELVVPLDPNKSPSENAQKYFQKHLKGKHAKAAVQEQIAKTQLELQYFETLLQQMESASPKDVEEIKEELIEEGYIHKRQRPTRKKQNVKPVLDQYVSTDGTTILVGKNNKQNDYLTMKAANKEDIWLHTKDIPGSHVVIRSANPSAETLQEAALLAAYFSKAKDSSGVPVDFTKIKHVRKPAGAKPGFVIYDHQQTIYVTPNIDKVIELKGNLGKNQ